MLSYTWSFGCSWNVYSDFFFICIKVFRFSFLGSVCMPLIYLWNFQFHFDGGVSVFLSEVWF